MDYTVQKLAKLAGVSPRTLRYYDEVGLLKPARINSSGYRIYGPKEVDKLQQILFYRELGMKLENIKNIINAPDFDELQALRDHLYKLLDRKKQLDLLIANVNKTIASKERGILMGDKEKFEGFKKEILENNERRYGKEIREKYGDDVVNRSINRVKNMTKEEYERVVSLEEEMFETLYKALKTGNPASELAQKAAHLHRQWISFFWDSYSKKAHAGVVQMYVDDKRFKDYYDKDQPGVAEFLRDAVLVYTGINN